MSVHAGKQEKVLVSDFFGRLKARGIAAYVRDLEHLERPGVELRIIRAPAAFRKLPTFLQNTLFALFEQLWMPILFLIMQPAAVVFPYNTSSILLCLSRRCVCVIHDFIPHRRPRQWWRPSYLYLYVTILIHGWARRPVAFVSGQTARILRATRILRHSEMIYLPNCFAVMRRTIAAGARDLAPIPPRAGRITLVSGHSANKNFAGALELLRMLAARESSGVELEVVGFGDRVEWARAQIKAAVDVDTFPGKITVHPYMAWPDLCALYKSSAFVWMHSRSEGFGRPVTEGRMMERPVLASDLRVFHEYADPHTVFYRTPREFLDSASGLLRQPPPGAPYGRAEELAAAARTGLRLLARA